MKKFIKIILKAITNFFSGDFEEFCFRKGFFISLAITILLVCIYRPTEKLFNYYKPEDVVIHLKELDNFSGKIATGYEYNPDRSIGIIKVPYKEGLSWKENSLCIIENIENVFNKAGIKITIIKKDPNFDNHYLFAEKNVLVKGNGQWSPLFQSQENNVIKYSYEKNVIIFFFVGAVLFFCIGTLMVCFIGITIKILNQILDLIEEPEKNLI